jgi:hypothetical protein
VCECERLHMVLYMVFAYGICILYGFIFAFITGGFCNIIALIIA